MTQRRTGKVKFFNSVKGYGFIVPDDPIEGQSVEIFVHHSVIFNGGAGFRSLAEGESVEFDLTIGPKGMLATSVYGLGNTPVRGDPRAANRTARNQNAHSSSSTPQYYPSPYMMPMGLPTGTMPVMTNTPLSNMPYYSMMMGGYDGFYNQVDPNLNLQAIHYDPSTAVQSEGRPVTNMRRYQQWQGYNAHGYNGQLPLHYDEYGHLDHGGQVTAGNEGAPHHSFGPEQLQQQE